MLEKKKIYCVQFFISGEHVGGVVSFAEVLKETPKQYQIGERSRGFSMLNFKKRVSKADMGVARRNEIFRDSPYHIRTIAVCEEKDLKEMEKATRDLALTIFTEHAKKFQKITESIESYQEEKGFQHTEL